MSSLLLVPVLTIVGVAFAALAVWVVVAALRAPAAPPPGTLRAGQTPRPGPECSAANRTAWMQGGGGGM